MNEQYFISYKSKVQSLNDRKPKRNEKKKQFFDSFQFVWVINVFSFKNVLILF